MRFDIFSVCLTILASGIHRWSYGLAIHTICTQALCIIFNQRLIVEKKSGKTGQKYIIFSAFSVVA